MTVNINLEKDILTATIEGKLDSTTSSDLETAVKDKLDDGIKHIILDLKKVDFISSKGLRVLVSLYRSVPEGNFKLLNPNDIVLEVLKLSGLLSIFKIETK